jgi:hypothetical protein
LPRTSGKLPGPWMARQRYSLNSSFTLLLR